MTLPPPTPHVHCNHELQKYSYRQGNDRRVCVSLCCCHCGQVDVKRYVTVPDPEHGPYGPKILEEVKA